MDIGSTGSDFDFSDFDTSTTLSPSAPLVQSIQQPRQLDTNFTQVTPTATVTTRITPKKVPNWVWILVGIVAIIIVSVAIILPIILLKSPHNVTNTVTNTSPTNPNIPVFNAVKTSAILFQLPLPALDGLGKASMNFTETNNETQVGYVLVGGTSKTGYYVTTMGDNTAISDPIILNNPSAVTSWATNIDGNIYIAVAPTSYFVCTSSMTNDTAPCQTMTWFAPNKIINTNFLVTAWKNVSDTVLISFAINSSSQYQVTLQTPTADLGLSQVFPGLGAASSIICMFATAHQTFLSFGIVEAFSNTVVYITYPSSTQLNPVQTITIDASNESLKYASMSFDGLWLIVLTSVRLILYNRNLNQLDFNEADSLFLQTNLGATKCALDQSNTDKIWCIIGSQQTYWITISVNKTKKQFVITDGRLIPSTVYEETTGVLNLQYLSDTNRLFLLGSDAFGNYENTVLDLSQY
jgi:hypothetical protein